MDLVVKFPYFFDSLNGSRYRRLEGRDSPTKRTKPKATKKANLAVRIQPSACTLCWADFCQMLMNLISEFFFFFICHFS